MSLLTGWVPKPTHQPLARAIGWLIGRRDLYSRLRVRAEMGLPPRRIRQAALAEATAQGLFILGERGLVPHSAAQALSWKLFGASGIRHLEGHDVLHVRSGAGQGGLIRKARRRGMRVIVDHSIAHPSHTEEMLTRFAHDDPSLETMRPDSPFWSVVLRDCDDADVVLVNSEFVRETFLQVGFPSERMAVAYLGVREDFIGLKRSWNIEGRPKLLFTGSFCARKGARQLLQAVRMLVGEGFDCELWIAGSVQYYSDTLEQLQREGRARLFGRIPQARLKEVLEAADLFVFPTLSEGCAKAAMEAMASGLPVVTTRSCGLPDHGGACARIVQEGSVDELCAAILELAKDEAGRRARGLAGQRLVSEHHTWNHYAKTVIGIYRDGKQ